MILSHSLKLYQWLTWISAPFIDAYLLHRKGKGKEDPQRFRERYGYASIPRPKGKLIWVHAASVGEAFSVLPLMHAITAQYSGINMVLTTGTVSSAHLIENRLPENIFHHYVPVDRVTAVKRFLGHWQPDLAMWVESELWPNLVTETKKHCPILLLSGRISNDSYRKWKRYRGLIKTILESFSLILAQSDIDAERFKTLGAAQVKLIGSIKYSAPALPSDPKKMGELVASIGERPVWLGASTHKGEEVILGNIHNALKEVQHGLLTIIAPRHPQRGKEIAQELTALGLKVALRSQQEKIAPDIDVYIADTLGEMGMFYRLVPIVFIGGTLIDRGGQNPLEPARLECAIIFGPSMENFHKIKTELLQHDAAISVENAQMLQEAVAELMSDHNRQEVLAKQAGAIMQEKHNTLEVFLKEIAPYIRNIAPIANNGDS